MNFLDKTANIVWIMQRSLSKSGLLKDRFKIELPRNNRVGVYNLLYSSHHITNSVENAFCGNNFPCFKSTEETFSHPWLKWYARLHVFEKCWLTVFFYNCYGVYFGILSIWFLSKRACKLLQNVSFILYDAHNVLSLNVLEWVYNHAKIAHTAQPTCVNVLPGS